ncbi:MAG: primosomal protein N' [Alphaproteobacteria bacterium]|nr:primosomal protein N' [Alphaproteobacteria bacterium]
MSATIEPGRGPGLFGPARRVAVLLPLPLAGAYDYIDEGLDLATGDVVEVPLSGRRVTGVVVGEGEGGVDESKLREVFRRFDVPRLPEVVLEFVSWVATYTLAPPGSVLRMALSVPAALRPADSIIAYARSGLEMPEGFRPTPARGRVLELLADGPPRTSTEISRELGVTASVVKGMAKAGVLATVELPADPPVPVPDPDTPRMMALDSDQRVAADFLIKAVRDDAFSVTVIDGVTGAGKTEVYFEAVAEALRHGRQVLILVPEIALSAPFLSRFEARFGVRPAEWHSELPPPRRRRTWRAIVEGRVQVLIGARSSLFLPFPNLGLIIVDEEHEAAYKQDDGVAYQGRDMAVVRARLGGIPVILVSATPSLETVTNVRRGRYEVVSLRSRHGGASLPKVIAIDMRREGPERGRWVAPELVRATIASLGRGEQAMLFLNRRGYAPLTLCRACGHRLECPNCSAWLVEHRLSQRLQCHHCGYVAGRPSECGECGGVDSFVPSGPGVERLAEEIYDRFPDARVQIASSDTLSGPSAAAEFSRAVRAGEVDIIIGTQVVAKGHHFPLLTTVGVIDADLGLVGGDLRAAERTYQLLHQVAGRAGREERPGSVFLQTHQPQNPVMRALIDWDRDGFLAEEARAREAAEMPPFGRLVALVVSARDAAPADEAARMLAHAAPRFTDVQVLGPAPAPLSLLRGRHRRRLLLKAGRSVNVQKVVRDWLANLKLPSAARVSVDVDPYGFM